MEELDLKELLQIFWEKKLQIILITAIFMAIGVIYTIAFVTPKYESKTTLLLRNNSYQIAIKVPTSIIFKIRLTITTQFLFLEKFFL